MDTKMISIVRVFGIIAIVLLLYLVNTESYGDPSIILFKLIFCGGGMFIVGFSWVKSEYMRSEFKRKEKEIERDRYSYNNYHKIGNQNSKDIYIIESKGNNFKYIIMLIAALATIVTTILSLIK